MRYRFALAAVLQVRELAAEAEERTLARIHAELARLRAALARAEVELRDSGAARLQALGAAPLAAMHLHAAYAAEEGLRARAGALRTQLAAFETLRTEQAARCARTWREAELLRRLRSRSEAAWRAKADKAEAGAAEEAFLLRQPRKSAGSTGAKQD